MKLNISRINTVELATVSSQLIKKSLQEKFSFVHKNPILLELKKEYNIYKDIYIKKTYSGKGISVKSSNNIRTKSFNSFKRYLNACIGLSFFSDKEKAQKLYDVFLNNNSKISNMPYAEKTAYINNIITQLNSEEYIKLIEELNLLESFNDLKEKQLNFEQTFSIQAKENAELRKKESASSSRKSLDKALKNYISLVTIMKKEKEWEDLYFELNEYVKAVQRK